MSVIHFSRRHVTVKLVRCCPAAVFSTSTLSTSKLFSVPKQQQRQRKWAPSYLVSLGATGALAFGLTVSSLLAEEEKERKTKILTQAGVRKEGLPDYRSSEVQFHDSEEKRIWVTYHEGVYDITDFIPNHPGAKNILMAAGGSVEPFWNLYAVHKDNEEVYGLLEQFRIGNLHPDDVAEVESYSQSEDPWANQPKRHPALRPANKTPFNAETPLSLLAENFITPTELFYVRNHLPVPKIDEKTFVLEIELLGTEEHVSLTLEDLKTKFPKQTITSTIQCGGNRRADMNRSKSVLGLSWEGGAIGNATWSGARLTDVLASLGVNINDPRIKHVQFEGADHGADGSPYGASVPAAKGLNPWGDVILAYEMNGQVLSRDHGFPVRVVVPGVVGARNVKWLQKIVLSGEESMSHWQQNDYKVLSPSVEDNPDFSKVPAIQNMPVTSVICEPEKNSSVKLNPDKTISVKGYAFSGGGNQIWRVDVSADGGKTWTEAQLQKEQQPEPPRHWSWTIWTAQVAVPKGVTNIELCSKAADSNNNVQPETYEGTWNLRGLLANAYSRINITIQE